MQSNGSTSEPINGGGVAVVGTDGMTDIASNPNGSSVGQSQSQPQQQPQLRNTASPGIQQLQSASMAGQDMASQSMGSNVHHLNSGGGGGGGGGGGEVGGGGYHQRHTQSSYNNQHQHHHHQQQQQQQIQSYHQHHYHQNRYNSNRGGENESIVNHVLLITVINPHYTITCDLIHQICSPYGKVNRIVIFKKNGVQAMVEFDNTDSAKRAKDMLCGCDIYSGCCTLRIEYAKPTRLNIHKNDNDSFDYTNQNLTGGTQSENHHQLHGGHHHSRSGRGGGNVINERGGDAGVNQHQHVQHQFHHSHQQHSQSSNPHHHVQQSVPQPAGTSGQHGSSPGYGPSATTDAFHQQDSGFNISRSGVGPPPDYVDSDPYMTGQSGGGGGGGGGQPIHNSLFSRQDGHQHQQHHQQQQQHHQHHLHHPRSNLGGGHNHISSFSSANSSNHALMSTSNMPPQGTVMMVYGLQLERVNCDRLFNLFCLYGNVVRVKFLRTKEGCAMVQMGDVLAVDRCVSSLNKITLFGSELQISYSKQAFLHDVMQPFILPDGSPSFKDFMGNKNNRFKNPEVASKNRILPPSQVLHFFNAPYGITEDELVHLFKQTAGNEPVTVKIFTPKADNSKSFSGLATFKDLGEATETLVICNHLTMPKPGAPHPYVLRLCFSPPTYFRLKSSN